MGVNADRPPQDRRRRDPAPGRAARRHAPVRRARGRRRDPRRRGHLGRADPRAPAAPASSSPARRRPPARSSGSRPSSGWEFIQIYGLTETTPLLTMNRGRAEWDDLSPGERAVKLSRAGAPAIGIRLDGRRPGRGARPRQPRARGLLGAARGDRRRDRRRLVPHRRRRRCIDDEGYLTISDRKKDVIISGGENVSSIEVEDAVFSHPDGGRGRGDRRARTRSGARPSSRSSCWPPGSEVTEQELRDHCRTKLAGFKVPDVGRVPRRAGPHRHRQAAEVQAARPRTGRAATGRSTEGLSGRSALTIMSVTNRL